MGERIRFGRRPLRWLVGAVVMISVLTLGMGLASADDVGVTALNAATGCPGDTVSASVTVSFTPTGAGQQYADSATIDVIITQTAAELAGFVVFQPSGTLTLPATYRDGGQVDYPTTVLVTIPTSATPGPYFFEGSITTEGPSPSGTSTRFGGPLPLSGSVLDCTDSDGDGVADSEDDFPLDPTRAVNCPAGFFGAFSCQPAAPGSFVPGPGALAATRCPVGAFAPGSGSVSCTLAGIGFFVDATGATSQTACPTGETTASTGSASADDCFPIDTDGDGVADVDDVCAGSEIGEADRPANLKKNRFYAAADGSFVGGDGESAGFTVADTGGCSASQIIDAAGLGRGHTKFGLSRGALAEWVASLN